MISIDALNPHYVLRAEDHAAGNSVSSEFSDAGSLCGERGQCRPDDHASESRHADHGNSAGTAWIFNNMLKDPNSNLIAAPMEYGNAIRVPTLWEAAQAAGLKTASILWPASLGARGIDYNIPPIHTQNTPEDHYLFEAVSRPDGFLESVEKQVGVYSSSQDEDEFVTRATIAVIHGQRPYLLTVHLSDLDEAQHHSGPDSPEAFAALEKIDSQARQIADAERAVYPNADIVIVSDHGFFPVTHVINLNAEFVRHGLITLSKRADHIASWKAFSWTGGGSAAVILHDPATGRRQKR